MSKYRAAGPARIIVNAKTRRYLYRVALAAIAVLAFYGIVNDEATVLWGTVAAAVLSLPLADANVNAGEPEDG